MHVFSLKDVLCERTLIHSLSGYTHERSNLRTVCEQLLILSTAKKSVLFPDILFAMSWVHSQRKCILTEDSLHSPVGESERQSAYCRVGSASSTGIMHNLQGLKERFRIIIIL